MNCDDNAENIANYHLQVLLIRHRNNVLESEVEITILPYRFFSMTTITNLTVEVCMFKEVEVANLLETFYLEI